MYDNHTFQTFQEQMRALTLKEKKTESQQKHKNMVPKIVMKAHHPFYYKNYTTTTNVKILKIQVHKKL